MSSTWLIFQNDCLLTKKLADSYVLLTDEMVDTLKEYISNQELLAELNGQHIYCAELANNIALPESYSLLSLKKALELVGTEWYGLVAKAYSVTVWDKTHQFCGACGAATKRKNVFERVCSVCSFCFYPRISPSVIVRIAKGDEILMARSPHFTPGAFGLIAGFVEPGENLEEAVYREVKEEVGIQIKNLQYFGSQAWPFPDSLMTAFTADYASGELVLDPIEIECADWYRFDQLPGGPSSNISIAKKLITHFVNEKIEYYRKR